MPIDDAWRVLKIDERYNRDAGTWTDLDEPWTLPRSDEEQNIPDIRFHGGQALSLAQELLEGAHTQIETNPLLAKGLIGVALQYLQNLNSMINTIPTSRPDLYRKFTETSPYEEQEIDWTPPGEGV
tara:strand:- start:55 stop:432 length:378 start_codon:yes stop_codon:yes gene_type:complete